MMKVTFMSETYDCARAVRSGDKATLYTIEDGAIEFGGVSDWSVFTLEGGDWSAPEPTREDKIEAQAMYTALMTDTLIEEG